jgi:hypothetical protein
MPDLSLCSPAGGIGKEEWIASRVLSSTLSEDYLDQSGIYFLFSFPKVLSLWPSPYSIHNDMILLSDCRRILAPESIEVDI